MSVILQWPGHQDWLVEQLVSRPQSQAFLGGFGSAVYCGRGIGHVQG